MCRIWVKLIATMATTSPAICWRKRRKGWTFIFGDGAYLWLVLEIPLFPKLVSVVSVVAAAYCVIRIHRRSISAGELLNVLMTCGLFLVALAPLLIVSQFTAAYRVRFATNGFELLMLFWLLRQLPIGSLRLASIFAALGTGCSFVDVYGASAAAHAEYALYPKSLANLSPHDFHSIAILRPSWRARQAFDFGANAAEPAMFDLLIGPRYKGEATFDVTYMLLPPTLPAVEANVDRYRWLSKRTPWRSIPRQCMECQVSRTR